VTRLLPHSISNVTSDIELAVRVGDAFDLINEVDESTVDLILTSPPYWGLRSYGFEYRDDILVQWLAAGRSPLEIPSFEWYRDAGGVLGLEPYPDWYVSHLVEFFELARSKLKPSGSVWVNLGDTYFSRWSSIRDEGRQGFNGKRLRRRTPSGGYLQDKQLLLVPARFAIAMQDGGWILRNDLIWSKPNVMPRPETDRLRLSHEHWFHFVLRNPRGRPRYFYDLDSCEDGARDVVTSFATRGTNGHTATFPPAVVRPRIASACPPGGLMLDPFCGTGRALTEALQSGRRALGFELSEAFARTARERILSCTSNPNAALRPDQQRCGGSGG
jgi:DNA modification methylase